MSTEPNLAIGSEDVGAIGAIFADVFFLATDLSVFSFSSVAALAASGFSGGCFDVSACFALFSS
jgi:hypothetical protein